MKGGGGHSSSASKLSSQRATKVLAPVASGRSPWLPNTPEATIESGQPAASQQPATCHGTPHAAPSRHHGIPSVCGQRAEEREGERPHDARRHTCESEDQMDGGAAQVCWACQPLFLRLCRVEL